MIRKLPERDVVEIFKRIYTGSSKKTLVIDDGSASGWEETDRFPKVGVCELLINDIHTPEHLRTFFAVLRRQYSRQKEMRFFFLEEEYVRDRPSIEIECDENLADEVVKLVDEGPNFNVVLVDASFNWALKLHHESFGYFSGEEEICNLLRESELANLIRNIVWL